MLSTFDPFEELDEAGGGSFFLLSGEPHPLPRIELKAVLEVEAPGKRVLELHPRLFLVLGLQDPLPIYNRCAYVRSGCRVVGWAESQAPSEPRLLAEGPKRGETLAVRSVDLTHTLSTQELSRSLGEGLLKAWEGLKVRMEEPDWLVEAVAFDGGIIIGRAMGGEKKWGHRRPSARPFFHPAALYPKMARALANLARPKRGELLLDPFCGTGSIIIEASLMGVKALGIDLARRMCRGSQINAKAYLAEVDLIRADALVPPLQKVDAIATDLPYGRASSSLGRDPQSLANSFAELVPELLKPGRYCCIMRSQSIRLRVPEHLELIQRESLPVHRSLTRAIEVFRLKG